MKLNQILAVERTTKNATKAIIDEAYKVVQKPTLFQGITQVYTPYNPEDKDLLPEKKTKVQFYAPKLLKDIKDAFEKLFDMTASRDYTNCSAKADVKVGETVLLKDVPTPHLLFLEKQLDDIRTLVSSFPTLDPTEEWDVDPTTNEYRTKAMTQYRQKKVPRNHVKAEATDKHPAQVELYHEDTSVGEFRTTKYSAELPKAQIDSMLSRVDQLREAVKFAREQANTIELVDRRGTSKELLKFIFG